MPKYDNLLDKLVADGAVDSAKAKTYQDKFDLYDEYAQLVEKNAEITNMEANVKMTMDMKMNNVSVMNMDMDSKIAAIMNLEQMDKSKFSVVGNTKMTISKILTGTESDTVTDTKMNAYYTDGVYYIDTAGQKIKMPMSFDEIFESLDIKALSKKEPISSIDTLSKQADGTYNVSYSAGYINSTVNNLFAQMGITTDDIQMSIDKVDMTITPQNGMIKGMTADMVYTMKVEGQTVVLDIKAVYDILKTGSSVGVELPADLNTYVDISSVGQ